MDDGKGRMGIGDRYSHRTDRGMTKRWLVLLRPVIALRRLVLALLLGALAARGDAGHDATHHEVDEGAVDGLAGEPAPEVQRPA